MKTRIVFISDTHMKHKQIEKLIPECDLVVHTGDMTGRGSVGELLSVNDFFRRLKDAGICQEVVAIAGNHDFGLQNNAAVARPILSDCVYLQDEEFSFRGLRIYGSPWQPEFFDWAFNLPRGKALKEKWDKIPDGVDIIMTHGPPQGVRDVCLDRYDPGKKVNVGCSDLAKAIKRIKPQVHVFGHIHDGYGVSDIDGVKYINASNLDEQYQAVNEPILVEVSTR